MGISYLDRKSGRGTGQQTRPDAWSGSVGDSILEAGEILFGTASGWVGPCSAEQAARLIGELASLGGFACAVAARHRFRFAKPASSTEYIVTVGPDGRRWISGYLPHLYLLKDPRSYLALALEGFDSSVTFAAAFDTLRHVLKTPDSFAVPRLDAVGMHDFRPHEVILSRWLVLRDRMEAAGLDASLYPQALAVATRLGLQATRGVLMREIAARMVVECAVPMVRVDPDTFDGPAYKP